MGRKVYENLHEHPFSHHLNVGEYTFRPTDPVGTKWYKIQPAKPFPI